MSETRAPFRIWLAGNDAWLPGPSFSTLELALSSARQLASQGEVALELPTRHWHTFEETGEPRLGPAQFGRGSNTDLSGRAAQALTQESMIGDNVSEQVVERINRSYQLSPRLRPTRPTRPTSRGIVAPSGAPARSETQSGARQTRVTKPMSSQSSQSARSFQRSARNSGVQFATGTERKTGPVVRTNERRGGERFDATHVLDEARCIIEARPTSIVDISETGLKLIVPAGIRVIVNGELDLTFSGRHGHFDLKTRTAWSANGELGLEIDNSGYNIVGRMFLRKMIARWVEREKRRNKHRR